MKIINRNNRMEHEMLLVDETIFSLSNGFIGVRGNFVEGYGFDQAKQSYMNGFYNQYSYKYEENSIHFPQNGERIVNIIDGQTMDISMNGTTVNMKNGSLISLHRSFDLDQGYSIRKAHYKMLDGKEILICEEKLVSFVQKELLIIHLEVTPLNFEGEIEIRSSLDLPKQRVENKMDPRINIAMNPEVSIEKKCLKLSSAAIHAKTTKTNLNLIVSMSHDKDAIYEESSSGVEAILSCKAKQNSPFSITKFVIFTSDILTPKYLENNTEILSITLKNGYSFYKDLQKKYLTAFWKQSLIEIEGPSDLSLILQYNIYQLNSSHSGIEAFNIASKGLSGEGYEGHYFWDTEIYMFPYFLLTNTEKALALIKNRFIHLKESKKEAEHLGSITGAKIPWRTIKGTELSPYYPAGSAQYHINSDVAYTVIKYYEYTADVLFLSEIGFELLVETGRFLLNVGNFENHHFHLNSVTGPDEYTALVNDNYYTNSMAKYHFEHIVSYYQRYQSELKGVITKIKLTSEEVTLFEKASKEMVLPFDPSRNIFAQDAGFLQKPILDLKSIPKENFPLLLHYHPLFIYRHQVLKQADTLLSLFLLGNDNPEVLRNNFDYYLPLTTHDSSLSKCIYSIIAAKLGDTSKSFEYLLDVIKIDFLDTHRNTHHGLHIASLGGSYLTVLFGILGIRILEDSLSIHPVLPNEITSLKVHFAYRNTLIIISIDSKELCIKVDRPIQIGIYNEIRLIEDEYHCELYIQ